MSFTSIRNDPARLQKEALISSETGRYYLSVPGQGLDLPYIEDPHIRLDKWGANGMYDLIGVSNDLKGLGRPLNRDNLNVHEYTKYISNSSCLNYKNSNMCITDESRAICPAFQFRGCEIPRWEEPFINPQSCVEIPFKNNIQTRILEKDTVNGVLKENIFNPQDWLPIHS